MMTYLSKRNVLIGIIAIIIIILILFRYNSDCVPGECFSQNGSPQVTLYYVNWCGFSKKILPEWEKLEKFMKDKPNVTINKIDCEKSGNMCDNIKGYPTIIITKDDNVIEFEKNSHGVLYDRNFDGIKQFLIDNNIIS
jgi:thiol-disulfide isomerase/thioredoxin